MMSHPIVGIPPVIPEQPKVLILGSMPSVKSLEKQQYYGHPRNHFWPIMFELFQVDPIDSYQERIQLVKQNGIALWDAIASCERTGSLDVHIKNETPNDIPGFLDQYPTIRLIACNGTKSYHIVKKFCFHKRLSSIDVLKLPSTSPIPGRYNKTFSEKLEEWKQIILYL